MDFFTAFLLILLFIILGAIGFISEMWIYMLIGLIAILAVLALFYYFAEKSPMKTVLIVGILLFAFIFGDKMSTNSKIKNNPVTIYKTTDVCIYYDEQFNEYTIPEGIFIAKYEDTKEKTSQLVVSGQHRRWVYSYYDGEVTKTTEAIIDPVILKPRYPNEEWHLEYLRTIKYKQFEKGNWWE